VHRLVADDRKEPPPTAGEVGEYELPRGPFAVEAALTEWQQACAALPPPATVPATIDGTGEDEHVFFRGDHHQRRALAPRRFLRALDGDSALVLPAGSGRLQLAERVFAADDPLPARVLVNRTWHHLFGRGLSRTVDNFGHLGEPPTHPELLDRLARDVVQDGWSQKRLIRRIVLSRTYAMDSRGDGAADAADPDNRWLHRHELRRLEGEPLRDAMLVFAGRLDPRLGGPSEPTPLDADDDSRGSPQVSGPVDGDGRRSIYLAIRRNFLPDFLLAFDLPTPFSTVGARSVANVPAQALALANDPFVVAMSRRAAERLAAGGAPDDAAALDGWFLAAFARPALVDERALCLDFLAARRRELGVGFTDARPWAALAHVLLARAEFRYVR